MINVLFCGNVFTKKGRWRMKKLVARFGKAVKGVLTGFDRIVFKGTILPLAHEDGAMSFLGSRSVLNRDYKKWMLSQTEALVTSVDQYAREQSGRPIAPLSTWRHDKEQLARKRQEQTGIDAGLIGVWSCLEGCWSYRAHYCAEKGYPQLHRYTTQCKHLYLYFDHTDYGWMNVRLQTWFPYHIQIALNGREWLRRRLEARDVGFLRQGGGHAVQVTGASRRYSRELALSTCDLHLPLLDAVAERVGHGFDHGGACGVDNHHDFAPAARMDHRKQRQRASLPWPSLDGHGQAARQLQQRSHVPGAGLPRRAAGSTLGRP
jgi:hypothetical protein